MCDNSFFRAYMTATLTQKVAFFQRMHFMLAGKEWQVSAKHSPLLSFFSSSFFTSLGH